MQPAPAAFGAPFPRGPARRRGARLDPPNAFHAVAHAFVPETPRPDWIVSADPQLAPLPVAPLAEPINGLPRSSKWLAMLLVSVALHASLAAAFLMRGDDDAALIAGSEEAGIVLQGNAAEDQAQESDISELDPATVVTLIPMLDARPVETVEATAVEAEAAELVEAVGRTAPIETSVVQAVPTEALRPVTEDTSLQAPPDQAAPAPRDPDAVATEAPVAPAAADTPAVDTLLEILATETPEIVSDDNIVAPAATAAPTTAEPVAPTPPETVVAETVVAETAETVDEFVDVPRPMPRPERVTEPVRTATPPTPQKPEPRQADAKKPEVKKPDTRKTEVKTANAKQPAPRADRRTAAGDGGDSRTRAKRGEATGEANNTRAAKAGRGNQSAAGNAAVTNYPGKVRGKIGRAAGRISRSVRASANNDVQVAFTVSANGALGGLRIARSSGSAALDKAALDAVRRAAPFPPIPDGAGRASWPFTLPMGLSR